MVERIQQVIDALMEMSEDNTVPRNVKSRLAKAMEILRSKQEPKIKVSKALEELDEVVDDPNMQPYTRSQIWNIVSMLETV